MKLDSLVIIVSVLPENSLKVLILGLVIIKITIIQLIVISKYLKNFLAIVKEL